MINIYFFGTPKFAFVILQELLKAEGYGTHFEVGGVFTKNGSPVQKLSFQEDMPCHTPKTKTELLKTVKRATKKDSIFLVAAYGFIFPPAILDYPKLGCFNIHASFLPNLRGASPIQKALLNGEKETGVSIIRMDTGVDTGNITAQKTISIDPEDTYPTLSCKIALEGAKLALKKLIRDLPQQPKLKKQTGTATYAPLVKKEDGFVSFKEIHENPKIVIRKLRAFTPWPGVFTIIKNKRVIIIKAHLESDDRLVIEKVQLEGKKPIFWKQFENGYLKG